MLHPYIKMKVPKMTLYKNEHSLERDMMELSCSFFLSQKHEMRIDFACFLKKQT